MPAEDRGEWPPGEAGLAIRERLAGVLDPEIDESIVDLGFVRRVRLDFGQARIELRLPTSWCALNFAYLMAADVRRALLDVAGIHAATVSLGDHCAAAEIETAVNAGRPFAEAFPGEGGGDLAALRLGFLRKGFLVRQERLLREFRALGCTAAAICALRLGEASARGEAIAIRRPGAAPVIGGSASVLRRYLERRAELGLDCSDAAPLFLDLAGRPLSVERLGIHYDEARTVRVALEANGLFCRALASRHRGSGGGSDVPP